MPNHFYSRQGVVASESFYASRIGLRILELGGNAVDASVATSLALTYLLPHLNGVGGDFLALVYDGGRVVSLLGLGWAPSSIRGRPPRFGLESAVVPGYTHGVYTLHKMFGELEWGKVVTEVVAMLKRGAVMHPSLVRAIKSYKASLLRDAGSRDTYLRLPLRPGAPYSIDGLLRFYELLAEMGPSAFYDVVARELSESNPYFSIDDFRSFKAEVKAPVELDYNGWVVYETPPPSMGAITLLTLKFSRATRDYQLRGPERVLDLVEASRRAYWARDRLLGDYDSAARRLLGLRREDVGVADRLSPGGDTTYFSVATKSLVVSAIQSLYYPFGSCFTDPRWQITFNNRASDFTDGVNAPKPRKRPMHTLSSVVMMSPTGEVVSLGSSGGHYRPVLYAQMIQCVALYGLDITRLLMEPRFVWEGGGVVRLEEGFELGNTPPRYKLVVEKYPSRLGVAQASLVNKGYVVGVADVRGDGASIGV